MCNSHSHDDVACNHGPRHGAALEHGDAHRQDHASWSRRDFMSTLGLASASLFAIGSTPVKAYGFVPGLESTQFGADRVLVLIQLKGGVDGLNVIIPTQNSTYYNKRPRISISGSEAISLNNQYGMHPSLQPLQSMWNSGNMAVVQGVGYPDHNLSHFRSTDIYESSRTDLSETTGWLGRHFEDLNPDYITNPPLHPLAVEINPVPSRTFFGPQGQMGVSLRDPETFSRIASSGSIYDINNVPASQYGDELSFVRSIANASFRYSGVIQDAANNAQNKVSYPISNDLADQLAIVARMIKGGLNTRFYTVQLSSFDTHTGQEVRLINLMSWLSQAVSKFYEDLAADGFADKVLACTFSEFGRRVEENGSLGTDHGTASPTLIFGPTNSMNGGFHGVAPSLTDLDSRGNMKHTVDFRSIYTTLLTDWLGIDCEDVSQVVGGEFDTVDFVQSNLVSSCGALPVELDMFTARADGRDIVVSWSTLSEAGNEGFFVEHASGGDFSEAGFVSATGEATGSQYTYRLEKMDPGTYSVRLRQVDTSGIVSYTRTVEVSVEVQESILMEAPYPNPANQSTTVKVAVAKSQQIRIDLFDMNGRMVRQVLREDMASNQARSLRIDVDDLASGSYMLVASGEQVRRSHMLSIVR